MLKGKGKEGWGWVGSASQAAATAVEAVITSGGGSNKDYPSSMSLDDIDDIRSALDSPVISATSESVASSAVPEAKRAA
eukprot:3583959-Rhodomonas_salina.1